MTRTVSKAEIAHLSGAPESYFVFQGGPLSCHNLMFLRYLNILLLFGNMSLLVSKSWVWLARKNNENVFV